MSKINFPEPGFKIKTVEGKEFIFDRLRKKWVILSPEEWVRQNIIQYLLSDKHYPSTLIAIEKEIKLGELKKRFDILVYNKLHQPWMMIECKAMSVKLDEKVLDQVLRYNLSVPVSYIVISNGTTTYCWHRKKTGIELIEDLPAIL
jgi:hypothetical protein